MQQFFLNQPFKTLFFTISFAKWMILHLTLDCIQATVILIYEFQNDTTSIKVTNAIMLIDSLLNIFYPK